MKTIIKLLFFIVIFISPMVSTPDEHAGKVIANNIDVSDMPLYEISDIFTRRKYKTMYGDFITVFIFPSMSLEHITFLSFWLGISEHQYKVAITRRVSSGKASEPFVVYSMEEMVEMVKQTPNSIGYVMMYDKNFADGQGLFEQSWYTQGVSEDR
jgi:hypothetical protein